MLVDVIKIAVLCILIGSASIPLSFGINASPIVVWLGNALGSLLSAVVVVYISDHLTSQTFKTRVSKTRLGRKIIATFENGDDQKNIAKAHNFIDKYGLKLFSFLCPLFPGVLVSTAIIYLLDLNKKTYTRWMFAGVVFVSGTYVFGYWWIFVK